tara:strand:+ start:1300 stop:2661 length:1362 start_codon:yes stop_codon:yes gene_type:complete
MAIYLSNFEKTLKSLLSVSFLLIIFDSYEIFEVPLSWLGSFLLTLIVFKLYRNEEIKFNQLMFVCVLLGLLPTLLTLSSSFNNEDEIIYILLRIFSFVSFAFISFVIAKSKYKRVVLESLKSIFYIVIFCSLYLYIAQIFNLYEPFRNRPGTGVLGFDQQNNFWISGSHRMVGTFREPVFLVSVLFPIFLVIHFKNMNSIKFYVGAALLFGLTKSELALVLVVLLIFIELIRKNIGLNNLLFFLVFFICFFIPIKECDISPSNLECPQYTITEGTSSNIIDTEEVGYNNESTENTVTNQLDSVQFEDRERSDIISFALDFVSLNSGFGFNNTNKIYTEHLSKNINHEMYLVNRTLPEYLKVKFLSKSFGTGRYFLTYENINIQNNFLFNIFSIGMIYVVFIMLFLIYFFYKDFDQGLKYLLLLASISLASFEDLLPIFGLCIGLMFTMDRDES